MRLEPHAALHTSAIRKSGAIRVTPSYKMATARTALACRVRRPAGADPADPALPSRRGRVALTKSGILVRTCGRKIDMSVNQVTFGSADMVNYWRHSLQALRSVAVPVTGFNARLRTIAERSGHGWIPP